MAKRLYVAYVDKGNTCDIELICGSGAGGFYTTIDSPYVCDAITEYAANRDKYNSVGEWLRAPYMDGKVDVIYDIAMFGDTMMTVLIGELRRIRTECGTFKSEEEFVKQLNYIDVRTMAMCARRDIDEDYKAILNHKGFQQTVPECNRNAGMVMTAFVGLADNYFRHMMED